MRKKIITLCVAVALGMTTSLKASATTDPATGSLESASNASSLPNGEPEPEDLPWDFDGWGLPGGVASYIDKDQYGYSDWVFVKNNTNRRIEVQGWYYDRRKDRWIFGGGRIISPGETKKLFQAGDAGIYLCHKWL